MSDLNPQITIGRCRHILADGSVCMKPGGVIENRCTDHFDQHDHLIRVAQSVLPILPEGCTLFIMPGGN